MTPLYQELHRWAGLPFIWGEADCVLCLGDWILRVTGEDPFVNLRGTYDSRGSCQRETGYFRDPVGVVGMYFAAQGIPFQTGDKRLGDVALINVRETDGRVTPCGAIWLGSAWGCKGPDGTTTLNPRVVLGELAVWSVGYEA